MNGGTDLSATLHRALMSDAFRGGSMDVMYAVGLGFPTAALTAHLHSAQPHTHP